MSTEQALDLLAAARALLEPLDRATWPERKRRAEELVKAAQAAWKEEAS